MLRRQSEIGAIPRQRLRHLRLQEGNEFLPDLASQVPGLRRVSGAAARPTTMPAAPAEAIRLTPYCFTESNVMSAAATVTMITRV